MRWSKKYSVWEFLFRFKSISDARFFVMECDRRYHDEILTGISFWSVNPKKLNGFLKIAGMVIDREKTPDDKIEELITASHALPSIFKDKELKRKGKDFLEKNNLMNEDRILLVDLSFSKEVDWNDVKKLAELSNGIELKIEDSDDDLIIWMSSISEITLLGNAPELMREKEVK